MPQGNCAEYVIGLCFGKLSFPGSAWRCLRQSREPGGPVKRILPDGMLASTAGVAMAMERSEDVKRFLGAGKRVDQMCWWGRGKMIKKGEETQD